VNNSMPQIVPVQGWGAGVSTYHRLLSAGKADFFGHQFSARAERRPSSLASATSTRLSKNVAPPPRSVRAVGVVAFTFVPPVCLLHQVPSATATPGLTVSPTIARAR